MTVERAAVCVAWMAGVLLGLGLAGEQGFWVAGGILMLMVVVFGLSTMFHDVKEKGDE